MIVAAHQPNYLPWLGYFHRMAKADLFILLDHVQFERQNYQNRARVKTDQGPRWLTVPVRQKSRDELIREKEIFNERDGRLEWGRKTFLTLQQSYARAPYFKDYAPGLREIFERRWDKLLDLNRALLDFCRGALGITTPMVSSSTLEVAGAKSELVLAMCRAVGADTYLAGLGGSRGYLDCEAFLKAGVRVAWQEFVHPVYPQAPQADGPLAGLSVVDLLFNCGPRSREILETEAASHDDAIHGRGADAAMVPGAAAQVRL